MTQQQILTHFFDNVVPAFERYLELSKKKDNKKAILLNTALDVAGKLFHFRDKLEPLAAPNTFRRTDVAKICPEFDWLGDVFNASKHTELARKDRIIKDSTHVEETIVWTYFPYEGEETYPRKFYSTVQRRIMVTPLRDKGSITDLLELCTTVLNFWGDLLKENGLIENYTKYKYEGNDIIPESLLDSKGGSFQPSYDGTARVPMIARYYEPNEKVFKRWGFSPSGGLNAIEIDEWAPNRKVYFCYDPKRVQQ